jgi:hypothetical protein
MSVVKGIYIQYTTVKKQVGSAGVASAGNKRI